MLKKMILSTVVAIGLSTTGAIAKKNTHLITLASKQETLSYSIGSAYKKQDNHSVLAAIRTFKSGQKKLKTQINNPEISNLLVYLNLCLKDLEKVVKKPYSLQNAQKVAELTASISEGSHYIAVSL